MRVLERWRELQTRYPRGTRVLRSGVTIFTLVMLLLPIPFTWWMVAPRLNPEASGGFRAPGLTTKIVHTRSGVDISYWDSAEPDLNRVALIQHGHGDWKIGMMDEAQMLRGLGYRVILPDLRGHGASGSALVTMGCKESEDTLDVLADAGVLRKPILLWGRSLGGATVALAAPHVPNLRGLILDSAFDGIPETLEQHRVLVNEFLPVPLPRYPLNLLMCVYFAVATRTNPWANRAVDALTRVDCPALVIGGEIDPRMPPRVTQRMFDALRNPRKQMWIAPGAGHIGAWGLHGKAFQEKVWWLVGEGFGEAAQEKVRGMNVK